MKGIFFVLFLLNFNKHLILLIRIILSKKLKPCDIYAISNDWFKSYLSNRKQDVSIKGYDSNQGNDSITTSRTGVRWVYTFSVILRDGKLGGWVELD